jgi:hypothetical protein
MEQIEDVVPALDLGASVALVSDAAELSHLLEGSEDGERFQVALAMLDDFQAIEDVTDWPREGMATLLGCRHPDPSAWLSVDVGELMHSQTVVELIREVAGMAATADPSVRSKSLRRLTAGASDVEVDAIARREISRSAVRLCKDLLRRSRGSTFAVRQVLEDGRVLGLVADDLPGDALLLGYERLAPRSRITASIEAQLGSAATGSIDEVEADEAETLDEVKAQIRAGLHLTDK